MLFTHNGKWEAFILIHVSECNELDGNSNLDFRFPIPTRYPFLHLASIVSTLLYLRAQHVPTSRKEANTSHAVIEPSDYIKEIEYPVILNLTYQTLQFIF